MGRKDAARFQAIEKRVYDLEQKTNDLLQMYGKIARKINQDFKAIRDTLTRVIEDDE